MNHEKKLPLDKQISAAEKRAAELAAAKRAAKSDSDAPKADESDNVPGDGGRIRKPPQHEQELER